MEEWKYSFTRSVLDEGELHAPSALPPGTHLTEGRQSSKLVTRKTRNVTEQLELTAPCSPMTSHFVRLYNARARSTPVTCACVRMAEMLGLFTHYTLKVLGARGSVVG
jgi:hypothetical protein